MARYKKYEYLPWWLNNLNDNTLTPTQKEVLDLDYYCKKHGTKLSHIRAAERIDRGRHTVYTARRRLEEIRLRTTEPAKGSYKLGHPIEYEDEAAWLADLQAHELDPRRFKMKRKSSSKKKIVKQSSSSSKLMESTAETAEVGESLPQSPAGSISVQRGEDTIYQLKARRHRDHIIKVGRTLEEATRLALVKYPKAEF